jgi:hypothetical protein
MNALNDLERIDAIAMSSRALIFARADNWPAAGSQVQELAGRFEGPGIQVLLIGLADTMLIHQGGPPPGVTDAVVVPLWLDNVGNIADVDDVRPEIRWAGRFIAARAADDEDACSALVNSIASDEEFTSCVCAMLEVVATTLNMIKGEPAL